MADLLLGAAEGVKSQFSWKEVDSSNTVFKLFAKASVGLCLLASILVASAEYLGKPITCEHGSKKLVDTPAGIYTAYCWIHGGKKLTDPRPGYGISEKQAEQFDCKVNYNTIDDDGGNDTLYYQWVSFIMIHNAILFKIPQLIWKFCEAGIMKKLHSGKGIGSVLMDFDQLERNLETHVASYKKLRGRKSIMYYSKFQLCEVFNYIILVWIWMQTNRFLSGHFYSYGIEVVNYYAKSPDLREHNPMCNTFPTVIGCSMPIVEPAGEVVRLNGICILSQNIINEKIYLFMWFWLVFMFAASAIQLILDVTILAIPAFRSWLIEQQTGTFYDGGQMNSFILNCNIGNWFLLYQIGKNTNREFFYKFIKKLSMDPKINIETHMGNGDIENPPYAEANTDEGVLLHQLNDNS